jgi:hypothetical protein
MNIRLVGASARADHGRMVYKNYYGDFPKIDDTNFLKALNDLIAKESIDIILPTHDTVLVKMAEMAAQIDTKIAVPGLKQAEICRSKKKIYELFSNQYFCPKYYKSIADIDTYPIYAKLDEGQGSKGASIIENVEKLRALENKDQFVFMEYLPGDELTIDCFTNRHGEVLFVGPRIRKRVFDGVCVNSESVPLTDEIAAIAKIVSDTIKIRGSWYFQLKKNNQEEWRLLEASVKIAGNMNLFRGLGVNFPLLMVYDYLDFDVKVIPNKYKLEVDRALNHRYVAHFDYHTAYIDFDDTITKNGMVNPAVLGFVYYMKNQGKKVHLITKHLHNLSETLQKLAIHGGIFDSIIHLEMQQKKSEFITETEGVIFIDNAYGERAEVAAKLGIPVFDVDAINTLIDYRE